MRWHQLAAGAAFFFFQATQGQAQEGLPPLTPEQAVVGKTLAAWDRANLVLADYNRRAGSYSSENVSAAAEVCANGAPEVPAHEDKKAQAIAAFKIMLDSAVACAEHIEAIYRAKEKDIARQYTGSSVLTTGPDGSSWSKTTEQEGLWQAQQLIEAKSREAASLKQYRDFFAPYLDVSSTDPAIQEKQNLMFQAVTALVETEIYMEKYPEIIDRFRGAEEGTYFKIYEPRDCSSNPISDVPKDQDAAYLVILKGAIDKATACAKHANELYTKNEYQMIEALDRESQKQPGHRLLNLEPSAEEKINNWIYQRVQDHYRMLTHQAFINSHAPALRQ